MSFITLDLGGHSAIVTVQRSALARRISLRVDPARGAVLMLPVKASLAEGQRFLLAHRVWLAERLARLPGPVALDHGASVPLLGVPHVIRHAPEARRGVWVEDGAVMVSGLLEHVGRRVGDFLKAEAKREIVPRAHDLAAKLGRKVGRVSVKDTRSRWGSCSSAGDLAFSWRLVLAPDWVLGYVVAHEVAHLVEMNHSPAFWAVVEDLVGDAKVHRRWLKLHGPGLHRFQVCATNGA
ncbi:MAG TPA: SprT family zinc-dependent metalloprotease [Magnetospirillum sp.]|jgi:predicted metal-dependent hydrolase|nr:SprT family zinc-dependent metalloprotease [Magnetospirillum sp.]